jgi:hypothetical protein
MQIVAGRVTAILALGEMRHAEAQSEDAMSVVAGKTELNPTNFDKAEATWLALFGAALAVFLAILAIYGPNAV